MKCKPWIRHFLHPKFECFSSQCALHGLRALEMFMPFFRGLIPRSYEIWPWHVKWLLVAQSFHNLSSLLTLLPHLRPCPTFPCLCPCPCLCPMACPPHHLQGCSMTHVGPSKIAPLRPKALQNLSLEKIYPTAPWQPNYCDNNYGAEFYTPPPPTPENTLLGVRGVEKGG